MQTGSGFIRFAIRYTTAGPCLSYLPYLTKDAVFPVLAMHILLNLSHVLVIHTPLNLSHVIVIRILLNLPHCNF